MRLAIINPSNEAMVDEIEMDSPDVVERKFDRAAAAKNAWRCVSIHDKKRMVARFSELLLEHKKELAETLCKEMGKPITQALKEVEDTAKRNQFFIDNVEKVIQDETVSAPHAKVTEVLSHEPLGVIANISAWNYPYYVGTNVFIPALLTGNCVLYKPSEYATLAGILMTKLLHQAGIPEDVFICVIGTGETGTAILNQPIDGVFFTGSYATGKKIAEVASRKMIKVQLELGGKDPTYVCEDVDIKRAVASLADGAFYNTGQSCCSVERIYVHEKIYQEFVDEFVREVKTYRIGDSSDPSTYIGPLTRSQQLDVLTAQVKDATEKGARLLLGGKRVERHGFYFEPTVLADVNNSMTVMREESFGPIIGIQSVRDDQEALKLMCDTDYGLTAGVYTNDVERAKKILREILTGTAYVNCCDRVSPALPWTGRKHSGIGSTLSLDGIRAFTVPKAWHIA